MTELVRIAAVVALVVGGLWAGVILAYAVERVNLWSRMPVDQYVVDFRRSIYRIDPMQPILGVIATLAGILVALFGPAPASIAAWVGVGLVVAVIVMSIIFPERINSLFRKRAEGEAPPGVESLRVQWRRLHLIRTAPTIAALVSLAIAATFVG